MHRFAINATSLYVLFGIQIELYTDDVNLTYLSNLLQNSMNIYDKCKKFNLFFIQISVLIKYSIL